MLTLLRATRLLTMVLWVGGLAFFAFILAPVAFRVLPTQREAGLVVAGTLPLLHRAGLLCGALFLIATLLLRTHSSSSTLRAQTALVSLMLLATLWLHVWLLPAMERDRTRAGGIIETLPPTSPDRLTFDRLHRLSEQVEGAVLLAGLAIVLLMSRPEVAILRPETVLRAPPPAL